MPKKKLTEHEITAIKDYLKGEYLGVDMELVCKISNSKDFSGKSGRSLKRISDFVTWLYKVKIGNKQKRIKNENGNYEYTQLTESDVAGITRLDRVWNIDTEVIEGIAMGTHHPLDGHELALDFGVEDAD